MLETRALSVNFGGVAALSDVTFDVAERSVVGLIGPNGAGKSTFIGAASGVVLPSAGTVTWRGTNLVGRRPDQIARLGVGRTHQHARLFPGLTALENVMIGGHLAGRSGVFSAMIRSPRWRDDEKRLRRAAREAMDAVHALHLSDHLSEDLTAGQQRLVAVARALAAEPALIFLDEPAAGLTDAERDLLAADLRRYFAARDATVLVVEHNLGFLLSLVSRIVVFDRGAVLAEGAPAEIRSDPAVIDAYLGAEHAAR
jgi:branched-chain amino acid transport system ATP-binding protein